MSIQVETTVNSILSVLQLPMQQVEEIVALAHRILENNLLPQQFNLQPKRIVGLIFEQPSHRTKNSFSSAAMWLGANILDLSDSYRDSRLRGESLSDFCHTAECYVDCLVVRSSNSELITQINELVKIPVINAGNGHNEHPTQAIADFSVIQKNCPDLKNLKISLIGCLQTSRCANSLALLLAPLQPRILMICPSELALKQEYQSIAQNRGATFQHSLSLSDALNDDILYFTGGTFLEDFADISEYERYHQWFTFPLAFLKDLSPQATILHPLPRGFELSSDVDNDRRVGIFDQVRHGLAVRKAILANLLGAML